MYLSDASLINSQEVFQLCLLGVSPKDISTYQSILKQYGYHEAAYDAIRGVVHPQREAYDEEYSLIYYKVKAAISNTVIIAAFSEV